MVVVAVAVVACVHLMATGPILQGGTKGTAAWPETPKQASNMLGGNLTPADRHGSVQVIPLLATGLLNSLPLLPLAARSPLVNKGFGTHKVNFSCFLGKIFLEVSSQCSELVVMCQVSFPSPETGLKVVLKHERKPLPTSLSSGIMLQVYSFSIAFSRAALRTFVCMQ